MPFLSIIFKPVNQRCNTMEVKMNQSTLSDALAALLGIIGSFLTINLAGISWQWFFDNATHALGLGAVAAFSGAMGVVGKNIGERIMKRFKWKKVK